MEDNIEINGSHCDWKHETRKVEADAFRDAEDICYWVFKTLMLRACKVRIWEFEKLGMV
jgi:hypothetical protein